MWCTDLTSNNALAGLRLLTTRPEKQAARLLQPLQQAGIETTQIPLIEIRPCELDAAARQKLMDLDLYHQVIVVSPSAADLLITQLEDYWPQWPVGIQWWCVGAGSVARLQQAGIEAGCPATGDKSEDLLQRPEFAHYDQQRVLLVKGAGGRDLLASTLTARGARVEPLVLYERVWPTLSPAQLQTLRQGEHQAVVLTSGEALAHYTHRLQGQRQDLPLFLPSQRLVDQARKSGFTQVINCQGAGAEAILSALLQYFSSAQ